MATATPLYFGDFMKLTLTTKELADLLTEALARFGDVDPNQIDFDLGEGNTLPLALVQGVVVNLDNK